MVNVAGAEASSRQSESVSASRLNAPCSIKKALATVIGVKDTIDAVGISKALLMGSPVPSSLLVISQTDEVAPDILVTTWDSLA